MEAVLEKPVSEKAVSEKPETTLPIGIRKAKFQPPRIVLNAVEGWGKTSCLAYMPKPLLLMSKGETGYDTLAGNGLAPEIPAELVESWEGLHKILDMLAKEESLPYKTLGLDATGGFEKLCHEYVCRTEYNGVWGDKGFGSYQKGYDVSITEWVKMLSKLDRIRNKGVMIMLIGHSKIGQYKNPIGNDFDRFTSDMHQKTWGVTLKWVDAALFGKFVTITEGKKESKKGVGGTDRIIYTEHRDAYDAKNRYGMPPEIDIPNDPSKIWETIWKHIYKK